MIYINKKSLKIALSVILIILFSYVFDFFTSPFFAKYTSFLLSKLRSVTEVDQNILGFLGVIMMRISQYITLFIVGIFISMFVNFISSKPILYAFLLALIFDIPSVITLIQNYEILYGNKLIYALGYISVFVIDVFSAFFGIKIGIILRGKCNSGDSIHN